MRQFNQYHLHAQSTLHHLRQETNRMREDLRLSRHQEDIANASRELCLMHSMVTDSGPFIARHQGTNNNGNAYYDHSLHHIHRPQIRTTPNLHYHANRRQTIPNHDYHASFDGAQSGNANEANPNYHASFDGVQSGNTNERRCRIYRAAVNDNSNNNNNNVKEMETLAMQHLQDALDKTGLTRKYLHNISHETSLFAWLKEGDVITKSEQVLNSIDNGTFYRFLLANKIISYKDHSRDEPRGHDPSRGNSTPGYRQQQQPPNHISTPFSYQEQQQQQQHIPTAHIPTHQQQQQQSGQKEPFTSPPRAAAAAAEAIRTKGSVHIATSSNSSSNRSNQDKRIPSQAGPHADRTSPTPSTPSPLHPECTSPTPSAAASLDQPGSQPTHNSTSPTPSTISSLNQQRAEQFGTKQQKMMYSKFKEKCQSQWRRDVSGTQQSCV